MKTKTTVHDGGSQNRGPRDPQVRRALLQAMKGALRRSVVLLPLTEDDDKLQEWLGGMLEFSA